MKVLQVDVGRMQMRIPSRWSPRKRAKPAKDTEFGQLLRWWLWVTDSPMDCLAENLGIHVATLNRFYYETTIHEKFLLLLVKMFEATIGTEEDMLTVELDDLRALASTLFEVAETRPWQQFAIKLQTHFLSKRVDK